MLMRYKTVQVGNTLTITGELEECPCYLCGGESVVNSCPGDGRLHHHGQVHIPKGGLEAVCANCIALVKMEWQLCRKSAK